VTEKNVVTAIRDALHDEMANDERIVLLGEDVGARGGVFRISDGWLDEFGEERVIDTPLAESGIVGVAIGMALHGLLPVAEIQFADFIHPAFDQIISEAARLRYRSNGDFGVPMVIRTPCGGGIHGALYHSQSIETFYAHVPGLKVVMPSRAADVPGLLASAIADPNPVVFVENKVLYFKAEEVPDEPEPVELGQALVLRPGRDLTIVALSRMVDEALAAAERLSAERGIEAEVIDPRTLVPLDLDTILESVGRTNRLLIAHEAVEQGGFGAELAARVQAAAFDDLDAPLERVGAPFAPVPVAPALEDSYVPGVNEIFAVAVRLTEP